MRSVCEIASLLLKDRGPTLRWLEHIELRADFYLSSNPKRDGAEPLRRARQMSRLARKAVDQGRADAAAMAALAALQAAWQAEITEGRVMVDQGVKLYRKAEAAREQKKDDTKRQRDRWHLDAAKIRSQHPTMSKTEIAKKISPARWNTIRKFI